MLQLVRIKEKEMILKALHIITSFHTLIDIVIIMVIVIIVTVIVVIIITFSRLVSIVAQRLTYKLLVSFDYAYVS